MRLTTRHHFLALLLLAALPIGAAGCGGEASRAAGGTRGTEENTRAACAAAAERIRAGCAAASADLQYTIDSLERNPDYAMALATKDLAWIPLCGGDADSIETTLLMGDTMASRYALLQLREVWCPGCAALAARERGN